MEDLLNIIIIITIIVMVIWKWKIVIKLFKDTFGVQIKKAEKDIPKTFYYRCERCGKTLQGWRTKMTCKCGGELSEISEARFNEEKKEGG